MSGSAQSEIVAASMSALEFHEAAWDAHDRECPPPDPSPLTDRALLAVLRYEGPDLPGDAFRALEAERRRRELPAGVVDRFLPVVALALLGLVGVIIWWVLLVP